MVPMFAPQINVPRGATGFTQSGSLRLVQVGGKVSSRDEWVANVARHCERMEC
jgi:hypothetical protein